METSAKHKINVDEAFFALVREIKRYNKENEYGIKGSSRNSPRHRRKRRSKCVVM